MDDLLIFIRALLVADAELGDLFESAGVAPSDVGDCVISPDLRTMAGYPRIILDGEEGEQIAYSDNAAPRHFRGIVTQEIVTREGAGGDSPDPLDLMRAIQARCTDLLLGNPALDLPGLKGQQITDAWSVTGWKQIKPTRRLPVTDPVYVRHITTYAVQLLRHF